MFLKKLKLIASTLLLFGYPAGALTVNDEPERSPTGQPPLIEAKPDDVAQSPPPGRMFVTGRVLDPDGKPVPRATVMVHARSLALVRNPRMSRTSGLPIGDTRADSLGRFRIEAPRTSSLLYEEFGAVALAPGYGAGWVELDPDDDQPTADISLPPERVIHGRLFDVQGGPVPDVTLSVSSITRVVPQDSAKARRPTDGVNFRGPTINDFGGWPKPVMSDSEGRFTLRGVGRGLQATLTAHHPRFALQTVVCAADGASESKPLTAALVPAQILNVRVTYGDTGKPVPHAPLEVMASRGRVGLPAEFETDAYGRARVNSRPSDGIFNIWAYPPEGQPYLIDHVRIDWPKAALEQSVDLALPRGVLIRGKVTEEGSGKPVPGATVDFSARAVPGDANSGGVRSSTASDGSFQLGAVPSWGYLFVKGPGDDYVYQTIGDRMVVARQPGGRRIYSHAHSALDLKPDMESLEVNLVLRRGATVKGRVVGPDGQPVRDAWMISRIILDPMTGVWGSWTGRHHANVRNGRFEIHGLDPDTEVHVYFLEPKRKLGATVNLTGKSAAGGPMTVRLEPCGAAKARIVGPGGEPVAGHLPRGSRAPMMVVTPGPHFTTTKSQANLLSADQANLSTVDPINYETELVCDDGGHITLPALIPGATYRLIDYTVPRGTDPELRKNFTVKPGETLDLGDIVIENPR
jgi:hypothetical protein